MKKLASPKTLSCLLLAISTALSTAGSTGCTSALLGPQISSRNEKFETALSAGRCEEALENIPEREGKIKFLGKVDRATGTALSYAATGAGYTADVVVTVVGGAVVFVALCGPLIAAQALSSNGQVGGSVACLPGDLTGLGSPQMGKEIYKTTQELRCPDLTALSKSVRRVASCIEAKPDRAHLEKAKQTLNSISGSDEVMNCITDEEKSAVREDLYRLDGEISRLPTAI